MDTSTAIPQTQAPDSVDICQKLYDWLKNSHRTKDEELLISFRALVDDTRYMYEPSASLAIRHATTEIQQRHMEINIEKSCLDLEHRLIVNARLTLTEGLQVNTLRKGHKSPSDIEDHRLRTVEICEALELTIYQTSQAEKSLKDIIIQSNQNLFDLYRWKLAIKDKHSLHVSLPIHSHSSNFAGFIQELGRLHDTWQIQWAFFLDRGDQSKASVQAHRQKGIPCMDADVDDIDSAVLIAQKLITMQEVDLSQLLIRYKPAKYWI